MEIATQRHMNEVASDIAKVNARVSESIGTLLEPATVDGYINVPNQLSEAATELERLSHELHVAL